MTRSISFPPSSDSASANEQLIEFQNKLVLIGANGSGKSRLGAWLERKLGEGAVRITAQKSLEIPDSFTFSSSDAAFSKLMFGHEGYTYHHRENGKYGDKPTGKTVNDFEGLLQLLFARDSEAAKKVRKAVDANNYDSSKPIISELQKIKSIWEKVLPHRVLNIELEGQLKAAKKLEIDGSGVEYLAGQMSDGERVIFYSLGKCLVAPENAVLIIDEPELHLHPTIRDSLWSALETERSDCTFIYITHDIDFALNRMEEQAIWLKSFDDTNWDWQYVTKSDDFPEALQLELLGSRRNILFVESIKGKLDERLYSVLYPEFLIVPCGSCDQVIRYVNAANQLQQFHHISPLGIVDADNRSPDEIDKLMSKKIFTLKAAEIENLFWSPDVLLLMEEFEECENAANVAQTALQKNITSYLDSEIVPAIIKKQIQRKFGLPKAKNIDEIQQALIDMASWDVKADAQTLKFAIQNAINNNDWEYLILTVEKKSLVRDISTYFRFSGEGYAEKVLTYLNSKDKDKQNRMRQAFSKYIPSLTGLRTNEGTP